jgi:hypothetical protein
MKERGRVRFCVCACVQVCVCLCVCGVHVCIWKCGHARKHLQILSDSKSVHMLCLCNSKFPVDLVFVHTWEWRVMPLPRSWLKLFSPITLRAVIAKASIELEFECSYHLWESFLREFLLGEILLRIYEKAYYKENILQWIDLKITLDLSESQPCDSDKSNLIFSHMCF